MTLNRELTKSEIIRLEGFEAEGISLECETCGRTWNVNGLREVDVMNEECPNCGADSDSLVPTTNIENARYDLCGYFFATCDIWESYWVTITDNDKQYIILCNGCASELLI